MIPNNRPGAAFPGDFQADPAGHRGLTAPSLGKNSRKVQQGGLDQPGKMGNGEPGTGSGHRIGFPLWILDTGKIWDAELGVDPGKIGNAQPGMGSPYRD